MNYSYFAPPESEHAGIEQALLQVLWQVDENAQYQIEYTGHTPDRMVAIRTIAGSGHLVTTDKSFLLSESSLCILPLSSIKSYQTAERRWNFFWMEFSNVRLDLTCYRTIPVDETEYCLLHDLAAALSAEEAALAQLNFRCLLGRWIYKNETPSDLLAVQTARYINAASLNQPLALEPLCARFDVSERTLRKRFQETFGTSPQQYAMDRRLKMVKVLLRTTSMKMKEIAEKTGFQNEYYLSSCFKKHFQSAPTAYRSSIRQPQCSKELQEDISKEKPEAD